MGRLKKALWIILFLTLTNYALMALWSLPALQAMANGQQIFDLRFSGYSFEQAQAIIGALGEKGAAFYQAIQHRLDFSYPALFALSLALSIILLAPVNWGRWRFIIGLIALPGAMFDYFENAAVGKMLALGADGLTPDSVATASQFTVLKSGSDVVAIGVLLGFFGIRFWQKLWGQKPSAR